MTKSSQFRPQPPVSLESQEWATDFNEIKDYRRKNSVQRSAQETATARFWIMDGPPAFHALAGRLVTASQVSIDDSARFMALVAVALNDAQIAGFDAKHFYNFWRPITAIRNGDIDGNPAAAREATWQPIDYTPMHPEYPCAHGILAGTVAAITKAVLGTEDVPEIAITSRSGRDVTHHWTNMVALTEEVANARVWAGFHYRFSTRVGTVMGRQIGEYVARSVMQPSTKTAFDHQPVGK